MKSTKKKSVLYDNLAWSSNATIAVLSFILIFLSISVIYSQSTDIKVTWGPEQKISKGKNEKEQSYFIGKDHIGGFYSLREKSKFFFGELKNIKRFIEHFDSDGNIIGSEKIIIKKENSKRFFNGVFYNEGRMYLVTNYFRSADKMNVLSVQIINSKTLLVDEDIRNIAEIPYKFESFYWHKHYTLKAIDNKIYALHYGPVKESKQVKLGIFVFDKHFKQLWQHYRILEYQEKLFKLKDYDVDSNGTIRVMAKVFNDEIKIFKTGKPNYEYRFLVFSNMGGDEFIEYSLTMSDIFITDIRCSYRPNGDIVCAGFYTNENNWFRSNPIAGTFFVTLDSKTTNVKIENHRAFSQEILSGGYSTDVEKKGKEFINFDIRSLNFLENGEVILLAEETSQFDTNINFSSTFHGTKNTQYGQAYTTTTTTTNINWTNYHFDRIVVLKFDPEGINEWIKFIPKKQHTTGDGGMFSSFATAYFGDKIYLIYNDNPKNLSATEGRIYSYKKNKDAVTVCAEIDFDGNINKKALFDTREVEVLTCPRSCRQTSINKMEIYGKKGKTFKWGVLEFQ